MDEGCGRSLVPLGKQRFQHPLHNKKVDKNNRAFSRGAVLFCFLSTGFFLPCISTAQSSASTSLAMPPDSTVSAAQLQVPAKAWAHLHSANKEFSNGNLEKAQRETDRALQVDPSCAPALSMRAFIELAAKDPNSAMEDAAHATRIDPHDAESFVALAMAYNSIKAFADALEAAQRAVDLRPDSWQGRLEMAKSLYGQGQFDLALRELNSVHQDFPDVHLVRGSVLMNLGRQEDAAQEFRIFLKEDPADPRDEQIRRIVAAISASE
jgi:tetratricopeptide (TPR) repeat protein